MKIVRIPDNHTEPLNEAQLVGTWEGHSKVCIYELLTQDAFNRFVGYAKFLNGSNGTVLYRGEHRLHPSMLPSGARPNAKPIGINLIKKVIADPKLMVEFQLHLRDVKRRQDYSELLVESAFQHYGASTYCMDFVDNHWVALWFGLNEYKDFRYRNRVFESSETNDDGYLYIFLCLADTNGSYFKGMYIGDTTYTMDLRKALQSNFLRPSAQHGWIIRDITRRARNYNDAVVAIAKISINNANKWLGNGTLLSQENFFPDYDHDIGYRKLLTRQVRSGYYSLRSRDVFIPKNTLTNYHYSKSFFISDKSFEIKKDIYYSYEKADGTKENKKITDLIILYHLLLTKGWTQNTSEYPSRWNENDVCIGQSGATALLIQSLFQGDVVSINYANRAHYYNFIDGVYIDFTSQEILSNRDLTKPDYHSISKATILNHSIRTQMLKQNCGLQFI